MNKILKRCSVVAASALLAFSAVFATSAAANDITVDGDSMSNGYIKISCDTGTSQLRMYTTGGDPDNTNDDNQRLLYGTSGSTSSTLLNVDDNLDFFSSAEGVFDVANKTHVSTRNIYGVDVQQNYTFITSDATGRDDLVEIKYTITNNDTTAHNCGVRIMIDTMLGSNDSAPFRIPNVGAVTTETTFTGSDIPEYYQAFDNLDNPSVVSYGTFDKTSSNPADSVQFMYWGRSNDKEWGITTTDGSSIGDSSVASIWEPKALQPGETRTYKMYYGLGKFVADTTGELQLAGYGANTATVNADATGYETSVVTAYVKNASDNALQNVNVTLNTGDGMSLADGQLTVNIGNLAPGEEKQVSWNVNFAPVNVETTVNYSVTATADNADSKTVSLSTILPALDVEIPTTEPTTAEPTTEEPTTVEPTTVAETTVDATSVTEPVATPDTATPDNAAVKTGGASMAVIVLTVLIASCGVMFAVRKRENI